MVGKKVYAVELKVIEDRRELRNEVVLFADKEHAKAFAQNFIEKFIKNAQKCLTVGRFSFIINR